MQRRSNAVSGCVQFPVESPDWRNTREGGLVVKLVVCDDREDEVHFGVCCGAFTVDVLSESLLADDQRPRPPTRDRYDTIQAVQAEQLENQAWAEFHFPRLHDEAASGIDSCISRPYLASIVLGSTGWSGYHLEDDRYWSCTFDDLSEAGKALYRQIQALYPGCTLHLLTFLDT